MEQKIKYQYSYFIHPYIIEEKNYHKYMLKLLKDKRYKLKVFEKEKDLNLYTYFLPNIRESLFWSFKYSRRQMNKFEQLDNNMKASLLAKNDCNIFEYSLSQSIQGKVGKANGIFFDMRKIEIICFKTGICFILLKTTVEGEEKFSDLLNFNYKFRDINADYGKLNNYDNIHLQANNFKDIKELSTLIKTITGPNVEAGSMNLDIDRFLTYSYVCLGTESWDSENEFDNIKDEFIKYTNVLPNTYQVNESLEEDQTLQLQRYTKIGFNKQSTALLTSGANVENYTKLPYTYEREYLYTYILTLYKKIYLKKINKKFKNKRTFAKTRNEFLNFTSMFWIQEVTNDKEGSLLYEKWNKILDLNYIYSEIKSKYDITYKDLNIEKTNKINLVIVAILAATLTFNIINFLMMYNRK